MPLNSLNIEFHLQTEYYALITKLDNFVVKLLNHIYTQAELELIINKVGKSNEEKYENLGRLKLAIRYQKKQFVVHPAIQQRLVYTWYAGKPLLEHSGLFQKLCGMLLVLIFYPVLLVAHLVRPKSQMGKILVYPCIKFMCHILSFIVFLSLIAISSLNQEKYLGQRFSEVLPDIYDQYVTFRNASKMDFFGQDFPLRKSSINEVEKDKSTKYLRQNLNSSAHFDEFLYQIYWLNADRYYWDMYDPDNISDATHALANILTFARISYVLPASSTLGPLQISLGRMIKVNDKLFPSL
ncbi:unnamed protein product [Acanthosepion pharaonis]|uniref:Uncharacterized protein n=1 Tax=Acanthosepion pharaonis TaxID=158019 RepID=A0A812C8D1_ACAPH|nr:unnamed protein product [Sepia pharaonis]